MDGSHFDSLTRIVGAASTRRNTLRSALGAAAASTGAVVGLAALTGGADAKKKRRKKCKKCKAQSAGSLCSTNKQCCTNETNRICALASGFNQTICCGGTGASCTSNDSCCRHFSCVAGACRA